MTDDGIKGLCLSIDNQGMKDERVGQCKSIHTLNICHTKVTEKGIQIAFENMPGLKQLFSHFPIEILADFSVRFPQFSLALLECRARDRYCPTLPPYKIGSLGLAAFMCPFVTKVEMELQEGITDVELLGLLKLKNLCELSINREYAGTVREQITFEGGVAPLLVAFGKSLTLLKLENLKIKTDIGIIFENCPVLSTLDLFCVNVQQPEFLRSQKILSKLKFLTVLRDPDHDEFPSYYLTSLLSSPELCKVSLTVQDSLTDEILLDAANRHQFLKLEELILEYCHVVTKLGIDVFFNDNNCLKKIELFECASLNEQDEDEWKRLIGQKNWQIDLNVATDF